jgi:class 3 adenylate cyclase
LHVGTAVARDGDYFGRNVALAARVAASAGGGQILASDDFRAALAADDRFAFTPRGEVELKGLADRHRLWELSSPLPRR